MRHFLDTAVHPCARVFALSAKSVCIARAESMNKHALSHTLLGVASCLRLEFLLSFWTASFLRRYLLCVSTRVDHATALGVPRVRRNSRRCADIRRMHRWCHPSLQGVAVLWLCSIDMFCFVLCSSPTRQYSCYQDDTEKERFRAVEQFPAPVHVFSILPCVSMVSALHKRCRAEHSRETLSAGRGKRARAHPKGALLCPATKRHIQVNMCESTHTGELKVRGDVWQTLRPKRTTETNETLLHCAQPQRGLAHEGWFWDDVKWMA